VRSARRRALAVAAIVLVTLLASSGDAAAQCAMCGLSAEAAAEPEAVSRTFATAILILLVPTTLMLGGAGLLLWKFRDGGPHRPSAAHAPDAPRRDRGRTESRGEVVQLKRERR
jgi:hypothetical protein